MKREIDGIKTSMSAMMNKMLQVKLVRIKEFFPEENAVTVQIIGVTDDHGGAVSRNRTGDQKIALGHRGDISEGAAPQPGDLGYLFFSGMQYKKGFVLLAHTEGGDEANAYVPVRGSWSLA